MATFHRDGWVYDPKEDIDFIKAQANGDLIHSDRCPAGYQPMLFMKWKASSSEIKKETALILDKLSEKMDKLSEDLDVIQNNDPIGLRIGKRGRPRKED